MSTCRDYTRVRSPLACALRRGSTHHPTRFHSRSRTAAAESVTAPQAAASSTQTKRLETSAFVSDSERFLFCSLYLSLRAPNESNILPTTHFFTSSSNILPSSSSSFSQLMTSNLFVCQFLFFQFFNILTLSTRSLTLCFPLTFQTVLYLTFSTAFTILKFPFCEK